MARDANIPSTGTKTAPATKTSTKQKNPATSTREAKDLKLLIDTLGQKNAPETSKDITAYAKQTLKIVAQSQKGESAAFRREATKTLISFREFVEKTEKITALRRNKLLADIDGASLDTKNAAFMLISLAKQQADNIKKIAKSDATRQAIELKHKESTVLAEAKARSDAIVEETRLKSKMLSTEQASKLKAIKDEHTAKYKALAEAHDASVKRDRDMVQKHRDALKTKVASDRVDLEAKKTNLKLSKDKATIELKRLKQDIKDKAHTAKVNRDLLETNLKAQFDARHQKQKQDASDFKLKSKKESDDIKQYRADSALKVKQLKGDLRDTYANRMRKGKAEIDTNKANNAHRNKARIQKIRDMKDESKVRLKKIEQDAKGDAIINKAKVKAEVDAVTHREDKKTHAANANANNLINKVGSGIADANPLVGAVYEIGKGIHGLLTRGGGEERKQKALNRLQHTRAGGAAGSRAPNAAGASGATPGAAPGPAPAGGMFSGLLSSLPSVVNIIKGIGSVFSSIVGGLGKISPLLAGGARLIPAIAIASTIIAGVMNFVDGFMGASALFGEKVADDDYMKRTYSGFVNVIGSILGIFDTVAGWLGFDSDVEGNFRKSAVAVFDKILGVFKSVAGGLADLLSYIPGMGGVAKDLKAYSMSPSTNSAPSKSESIKSKQTQVDDLKDDVDAKKNRAASVNVVSDNSVKTNSTTVVQSKMDTRNDDRTHGQYGYNVNR